MPAGQKKTRDNSGDGDRCQGNEDHTSEEPAIVAGGSAGASFCHRPMTPHDIRNACGVPIQRTGMLPTAIAFLDLNAIKQHYAKWQSHRLKLLL
jgi:hypothetical protein